MPSTPAGAPGAPNGASTNDTCGAISSSGSPPSSTSTSPPEQIEEALQAVAVLQQLDEPLQPFALGQLGRLEHRREARVIQPRLGWLAELGKELRDQLQAGRLERMKVAHFRRRNASAQLRGAIHLRAQSIEDGLFDLVLRPPPPLANDAVGHDGDNLNEPVVLGNQVEVA